MSRSDRSPLPDLDDLLRPVLSEDDDSGEMDRPWNPRMLLFWSFFVGPLAGGTLLAINSRRLGLKDRFWPLLIGTIVGTLVLYASVMSVMITAFADWDKDTRNTTGRMMIRAVTVLAGWLVSGPQRRRYRLAEAVDAPLGSLWGLGTLICIVGFVIEIYLAVGIATIIVKLLLPLPEAG